MGADVDKGDGAVDLRLEQDLSLEMVMGQRGGKERNIEASKTTGDI